MFAYTNALTIDDRSRASVPAVIIIIRSASHTVALVQTKIATYTKKINLKSKSKYTKERFYLNQY